MVRVLFALVCSAGCLAALAQEPKKESPKPKPPEHIAVNDPAKLTEDADFAAQGEYFGEGKGKKGNDSGSLQVVALGGTGSSASKAFGGGLPGDEGPELTPSTESHD